MNELALFAGAGGGILGGMLLGWRTVAAVEIEEYPRAVLLQRQADGILPRFPIWDDVKTFNGREWRGKIDVISGGFPCQDISTAGKGAGITGERSGLWKEFARIISEVRPCLTFVENSPMLTSRGLGTVLGDLAEIGYNAEWCVLGADDVGAPHRRKRMWILAYPNSKYVSWGIVGESKTERWEQPGKEPIGLCCNGVRKVEMADTDHVRNRRRNRSLEYSKEELQEHRRGQTYGGMELWGAEPSVGRVADGVAHRVDRLKAIGNGQVPAVAAEAFKILLGRILENCTR